MAVVDLYCDPVSGDDANDGAIGTPMKTLNAIIENKKGASTLHSNGDTVNIHCKAGDYPEVKYNSGASTGNSLMVWANTYSGGRDFVIDLWSGETGTINLTGSASCLYVTSSSITTIGSITFRNTKFIPASGAGYVFRISDSWKVIVDDSCTFDLSNAASDLRYFAAYAVALTDPEFTLTGPHTIDMQDDDIDFMYWMGGAKMHITDVTITGMAGGGDLIRIKNNCDDLKIDNVINTDHDGTGEVLNAVLMNCKSCTSCIVTNITAYGYAGGIQFEYPPQSYYFADINITLTQANLSGVGFKLGANQAWDGFAFNSAAKSVTKTDAFLYYTSVDTTDFLRVMGGGDGHAENGMYRVASITDKDTIVLVDDPTDGTNETDGLCDLVGLLGDFEGSGTIRDISVVITGGGGTNQHAMMFGVGCNGASIRNLTASGGNYQIVVKGNSCSYDNIVAYGANCLLIGRGKGNTINHATLIATSGYALAWSLNQDNVEPKNNSVTNSVMYALSGAGTLAVYGPTAGTEHYDIDLDYNVYWKGSGVTNLTELGTVNCDTLAAIQAKWLAWSEMHPLNDANSLVVDPRIANPAGGDYRILNPVLFQSGRPDALSRNQYIGAYAPEFKVRRIRGRERYQPGTFLYGY